MHLVQRGGNWAGPQLPRPLLAVPDVTAHPSTVSVPITASINPLLCGFNKGLKIFYTALSGYSLDAVYAEVKFIR